MSCLAFSEHLCYFGSMITSVPCSLNSGQASGWPGEWVSPWEEARTSGQEPWDSFAPAYVGQSSEESWAVWSLGGHFTEQEAGREAGRQVSDSRVHRSAWLWPVC